MNYQNIYNSLIESRRLMRPFDKKTKGFEWHHVLMKSMGGSDDPSNRVNLTYREHFIAHRLLYLIHKNRKTSYALWLMCNANKLKLNVSSRVYEEVRENFIKIGVSDETRKKHKR